MLTNRETNAAIKRELKAAGYNTKSFKVSVKDCGYSTSAHVTIKDPAVKRSDVEKLLMHWDEIDRDERTGEILAGGNFYMFVDYEYGLFDEVSAKYIDEAEKVLRSSEDIVTVRPGLLYYGYRLHDSKSRCTAIGGAKELAKYIYLYQQFGTIGA